jgi:hypothetical protein
MIYAAQGNDFELSCTFGREEWLPGDYLDFRAITLVTHGHDRRSSHPLAAPVAPWISKFAPPTPSSLLPTTPRALSWTSE